MTFLLVFVIFAVLVGSAAWLLRKDAARRKAAALKEAEFIAAMRANPRGVVVRNTPQAVAPLITGRDFSQPLAKPVANLKVNAGSERVADIVTALGTAPVATIGVAGSAVPAASLRPPRDGHCMVCRDLVDVRANDPARWGVKIPEPGSDRLTWIHFNCLSAQLERAGETRAALHLLVDAVKQDAAATLRLEPELTRADAALGRGLA